MDFTNKKLMGFFLLIPVILFFGQVCLADTYIFRPEDNSVYIDQRDPDSNFVSFTGLMVVSELSENARTVIHFNLSGWSPDSISHARLHLYHYRGGNYTNSRTINVYSLTTAFNEATATWNSPWTTPEGDYDNTITSSAEVPIAWENWVSWNVTSIVKNKWNNVANCGFLIRDPLEDAPPSGPYVRFHSHRKDSLPYLEVTTEEKAPMLDEWGLIFLVALIAFSAYAVLRKRRRTVEIG